MNSNRVEVRILRPGDQAASIVRHFETWFVPDGLDLVFYSALPVEAEVSEHLKWFYTMLQHHQKFIRQLEGLGVQCICRVQVRNRSVVIEPEALLLAHQLHLPTEIAFRS